MLEESVISPGHQAQKVASELVELIGESLANFLRSWPDPDEARAIAAAAATVFAGTQLGLLIGCDEIEPDEAQMLEASALCNLRAGIAAGLVAASQRGSLQ